MKFVQVNEKKENLDCFEFHTRFDPMVDVEIFFFYFFLVGVCVCERYNPDPLRSWWSR